VERVSAFLFHRGGDDEVHVHAVPMFHVNGWGAPHWMTLVGGRHVMLRKFDPGALLKGKPRAIVISPGPGTPARAGRIVDLIRLDKNTPLLGVCLGHQAIGEAFGARVVRGSLPVHGKVTEVRHDGEGLFAGCPAPMQTARYHSLIVDRATLPKELRVDAETPEGVVMAVSHRQRPMYGIQFHPESYGTPDGDQIVINFLRGTT